MIRGNKQTGKGEIEQEEEGREKGKGKGKEKAKGFIFVEAVDQRGDMDLKWGRRAAGMLIEMTVRGRRSVVPLVKVPLSAVMAVGRCDPSLPVVWAPLLGLVLLPGSRCASCRAMYDSTFPTKDISSKGYPEVLTS